MAVTVYSFTLCRTVFIGDSGELALVFKLLGIAHPPGYPLFTLLGRVFLVFTGYFTPAFSANLFGAVIAAAIVPPLFVILKGKKIPVVAGLTIPLWLFAPAFWGETAGVEVYTLNLLFIALITALALSDRPRKWYLTAYIFGLALAHHPTVIVILPSIVYFIFTERGAGNSRRLRICIILFLLGLSVYWYIPVRASLSPLADWGHPASFTRLLQHITASEYQHAASFAGDNIWQSLKLSGGIIIDNWWWTGAIFSLFGAIVGLKYYFRRTLFALLLLISTIVLISFYQIPDIDSYLLPGLFACFILIGNGAEWLWNQFSHGYTRFVLIVIIAGASLWLLAGNYKTVDRSDYTLANDYGKLILDTAGEGTVFTGDDISSFPALYLRYAEGYRPQVEVFDRSIRLHSLIKQTGGKTTGNSLRDYLSARADYFKKRQGEKHLVKSHHLYHDDWLQVPSKLHSNGILYSTRAPSGDARIPYNSINSKSVDFKSRQLLVNLELCRGEEYLLRTPPDSSDAVQSFLRARWLMEEEPRGELHNQMGIFFRRFGFEELALASYREGLESPRLSDSERSEIIFNISNVYKDRGNRMVAGGNYRGAAQAFSQALKYDPNNPKLLYNVGIILLEYLEMPEEGIPYLEAYLKLNPADVRTRELVNSHRSP